MQSLTSRDFYAVLDCLQDLYSPCCLDDFPARVLKKISKAVSAEDSMYTQLAFLQRRVTVFWKDNAANLDPIDSSELERIAHQHFYENPLVKHYLQTRDHRAHKISDFVDLQGLQRLEGVYQKYLRPRGMVDMIGISLPVSLVLTNEDEITQSQEDIMTFTFNRSHNFTEQDRQVLNLLHSHLLQACQTIQQYSQIQREWTRQSDVLETLGVVCLNRNRQVKWMSQRAFQWLQQYFPDSQVSTQRLPDHLQHWMKHQLTLLTQKSDFPAPLLPLQIEDGGKRLTVRLVEDRPSERYILLLEEQLLLALSPTSFELLGLTRREAEVIFWLVKGKRNPEIAAELTLSVGTVRKHLEHIYLKLEVTTRAAAVTRALQRLGLLQ